MKAKFTVGQVVYWETFDLMRAEVVEIIPRKCRKPKYRLRWIDENDHESVVDEGKLTSRSIYWKVP